MGITISPSETSQLNMSSQDQAHAVDAPAAAKAPAPKMKTAKKSQVKGKDSSSGKPKYRDMVIDAIATQKERSGSSLSAIKNHLGSKYKVDVAKKAGTLNSVLKKMREEGVLVAGAQPGRKGAGCFKVSPEEKSRMAGVAKAAAKKLKAQQKQGLGKVSSKAPKKVAKIGAGKKAATASKVGKKVSAKKAGVSKRPAPKSNKGVAGKVGAKAGKTSKKAALKTNKGKASKK